MPMTSTLLLGLLALVVSVGVIGVGRTKEVTASGAVAAKSAIDTSAAWVLAGAGFGLQFGAEVIGAIGAEPYGFVAALAGIGGFLGIEGLLELSGLQFLLIAVILFATAAWIKGDA